MSVTERPPNSVFDDDTERVESPLKISVPIPASLRTFLIHPDIVERTTELWGLTKLWGLTFVLPTPNFPSFKDFYKVATTHNLVSFSNV